MAWREILVYLDYSKQAGQRLQTALELARAAEARLVGLSIAPIADLPFAYPADMTHRQRESADDHNRRVKAVFDEGTRGSEVEVEWHAEVCTAGAAEIVNLIALYGHYADLAVVGQPDPDEHAFATPNDLPGQVAMVAGRPVLAVPYAWNPQPVGRRVIVAWNGSREATRAVHDALPLLSRAEEVRVLSMSTDERDQQRSEESGNRMVTHLGRHGINAAYRHDVVKDGHVPEALLSEAADYGADLIVMGAYGKSRVREIVMGGASRGVLRSMTVPVLMAH